MCLYQQKSADFVLTIYLLLHARTHTPTSVPVVIFSFARERDLERKSAFVRLLLPCLRRGE